MGLLKKKKKKREAGDVFGLKAELYQRCKVLCPACWVISVFYYVSFYVLHHSFVLSVHWYMEDCGAIDVLAEGL